MRKISGIVLILIGILLLAPLGAEACPGCSNPGLWDPNCADSGCTYCFGCSLCCGGDPNRGDNCFQFCGGAALLKRGTEITLTQIFQGPSETASAAPGFLATLSSASCITGRP